MTSCAISDALMALASVSAVVWTGGLIVLQLRRVSPMYQESQPQQQHHLINAGMACAAYSFLVPLLGIFTSGSLVRVIAFAAAILYIIMTVDNIRSITQGLASKDRTAIYIGTGYLLPTIMLLLLAAFPSTDVIVWSAGGLLFASYFVLSFMTRTLY